MIFDQIKLDILSLQRFMENIKADAVTFEVDNKLLQGAVLDAAKELRINWCKSEILRLNAILAFRKVPKIYISPVNNQTYHRPSEESSSKRNTNTNFLSNCTKMPRKSSGLTRSSFFLQSHAGKPVAHFSMEHRSDKEYPHGGFAEKVKQGFVDLSTTPTYAIKVFKKNLYNGTANEELRVAMRAAFCARILGRTGHAFRHNKKQYFVTDWHPGCPLSKVDPDYLTKTPIENRIALALDLIRQIAILHAHNFIHCDIKPGNVIMSDNSLKLIDLDSIIIKDEPHFSGVTVTPAFLDPNLNWHSNNKDNTHKELNEKSDLYALGITLAFLFPELITHTHEIITKYPDKTSTDSYDYEQMVLHQGPLYKNHSQLAGLIMSLSALDPNARPESAEAAFHTLSLLGKSKYGTNYPLECKVNKAVSSKTGIKAFEEIETEINCYSH